MDRVRRWILVASLGAAVVIAGPAAGEPEAAVGAGPLEVRLDVASARPSPPGLERPLRAIGAGALPEPREEASLDARFDFDFGRASQLGLHYRGTLAREGAREPRNRQRHVPELRFRRRLAEGWTARLGWRATAEWQGGAERNLLLGGLGFAELELEIEEAWGRTRVRYEHQRFDLLDGAEAPAPRHRASAHHALPRIELPEGFALELRPSVALDVAATGEAQAPEVLDARMTALLESRMGPRLRTRFGYARRHWAHGADDASLRAGTRLELPVREGLQIGLELGWEGAHEGAPSALSTRAGIELHF